MQLNQRTAGILLNYAGEAVKVLTVLIYTPVMLRLLGQSEYGLYQLVSSTVSYLSLLSLGFGSAYMRFYSRYAVKEDHKGIAKLNGMFLLIFTAMAGLCLVCGTIMTANAQWIFGEGLTSAELAQARKLMGILVFSMALTFPNSVFSSYITAHEQFVFQKLLNLFQSVLNPFLALPLLLLGYGSVAVVAVSALLTGLVFVSNILFCRKELKIRFSFKGLKFSLLKEMWAFTFFVFLTQIIDQLNWNVDKLILGRVSGTAAVAVYGIGGQINHLYLSFSSMISGVFAPKINRIAARNEENMNEELSLLMIQIGRLVFMVSLYIYIGFLFCGRQFVLVWAGKEYLDAYYVALLLITPLVIILPHSAGIEIRRAKNLHRVPSLLMLLTTLCNAAISIPLAYLWGAVGAAAGTFTCLLLNQIMIDWYYIKVVKLDIYKLLYNLIDIFYKCVVPILFGLLGLRLQSFAKCIAWAIAYSILYLIVVYKKAMNETEKSLVKSLLARVKRGDA